MKRFLPSIVFVLICVSVSFAQAPKGINYQGVARDSEGNPLVSKTIAVRISILKTSATGDVEYSETHKPTTNQFGLFTLIIGQGTKVTGDFTFISWAIGNKWLQIEIDPNGGVDYTLAGTQQLMSVPYALYAEYTGSSGLSAGPGIAINSGVVSNTGDADKDPTNELQNLADVLTKSNNAGTVRITNLGTPTAGSDAATKSYVDAQDALDLDIDPTNELQNLSQLLARGNNANAQKITNLGTPVSSTDATTKSYVDGKFALQTLAQILTTGNDAGSKQIKNLGAPADANDAATKNYVDALNALDLDTDPTNELQDLSQVLTKGNDAGGKKITNLGAPTLTSDAATKSYVDAENSLDLDKSATNEIQDLALNTTTNILRITNNPSATNIDLSPYKQNLNQVLTNSNDAGTKTITNLGAPVVNSDATTKLYVDNAIATNYAFKVPYSFTNSGIAAINQVVSLGADIYDDFSVVATNRFTTPVDGIYMFYVDGTLNNAGINQEIRVNSTIIYPIRKQDIIIGASVFASNMLSLMVKLSKNDYVEIYITSFVPGDNVSGTFFGYKL